MVEDPRRRFELELSNIHGLVVGDRATQINNYFQGLKPQYVLEDFHPDLLVDPADLLWQPSRLLSVSNQVVAFTGREHELAELQAWLDNTTPGMTVQLWHASGGHGKTRLANELAAVSFRAGWKVMHARQHGTVRLSTSTDLASQHESYPDTLLIVDYAERWPAADLWYLLANARWHAGTTRVLALARTAGAWWTSLAFKLERQVSVTATARQLEPLGVTDSQCKQLFQTARDRFAYLLEVADAEAIDPPPNLRRDTQGLVLGVHMAALAAVYAKAGAQPTPYGQSAISIYLLQREQERWHAMHADAGRPTRPEMIARAVYLANLTRSMPFRAAVNVLTKSGMAANAEVASQILHDHALSYPPSDPAAVLEPMYPDRLSEDFYALSTPGHTNQHFTADPWATDCQLRPKSGQLFRANIEPLDDAV